MCLPCQIMGYDCSSGLRRCLENVNNCWPEWRARSALSPSDIPTFPWVTRTKGKARDGLTLPRVSVAARGPVVWARQGRGKGWFNNPGVSLLYTPPPMKVARMINKPLSHSAGRIIVQLKRMALISRSGNIGRLFKHLSTVTVQKIITQLTLTPVTVHPYLPRSPAPCVRFSSSASHWCKNY